jgi:glycosyltransferase involved in cell wall biosynthesis
VTRPLRVMLLTSADHWRGSGKSYANLARGLAARGHEMEVVVSSPMVAAEFERLGIGVRQLPLRRTGVREIIALRALARVARTQVVIVDKPRDLRLAAWMDMLHSVRIVIRYNRIGAGRAPRFVDRWTARRASAALYQCEYVHEHALANLPLLARLPSFVVHNGYDVGTMVTSAAARGEWRAAHGIAPNDFVVISAGFAEEGKRFEQSVAALALLAAEGVAATFVFCGDGPCRLALEAQARAGGVAAIWLGRRSPREALAVIAAADVLMHPSPTEIFGNVLAEAMGLGTPIIAVRAGGNMELLGGDGRAALLVANASAAALAGALRELYAAPARRAGLAAAARERIVREFPLSRMIDGYDAMLSRVVFGAPVPQ